MEEITIYKFQLENIADALRMTANHLNSRKGETAMDRSIRDAEQYAKNALAGNKDLIVRFGKSIATDNTTNK